MKSSFLNQRQSEPTANPVNPIPQQDAPEPLGSTACSRYTAARIEELLQASNDLSEGDEIKYEDARDLALYALDEMERVRNAYQARFGDLMLKAMDLTTSFAEAMPFPENDKSDGTAAPDANSKNDLNGGCHPRNVG